MKGFLFIVCFLLLFHSLGAETLYYRSNGGAMELEALDESQDMEWLLEVRREEGQEIRILFHDGLEEQRWEIQNDQPALTREHFYRLGKLVSVTDYNVQGDILLEEYYMNEELSLSREYQYPQENLVIRTVQDRNLEESYSERMRYRSDGRLLSLYRSQGEMHQNWMLSESEGDQAQWLLRQGQGQMTLYNSQGRIYRILDMGTDSIEREERRSYDEEGRLISAEVDLPLAGEFLKQRFDSQERLVEEQLFRNNVLVSLTSFRYTGALLVEKKLSGQGIPQRWEYIYQDGRLIRTDYYLGQGLYEQTYAHGQSAPEGEED